MADSAALKPRTYCYLNDDNDKNLKKAEMSKKVCHKRKT